jgi:stage III sporulation protein AA
VLDRKVKEEILDKIGGETGSILQKAYVNIAHVFDNAEEIRIRAGLPLIVVSRGVHYMITQRGQTGDVNSAYKPNYHEISLIFTQLCRYSVYAYAEDIKNGFITLQGGHRVGISGRILPDGNMRDISSLNIRISRQIKDCARIFLPYIIRNPRDIYNTLIISPPCSGKTTIIRDLARLLSTGTTSPDFVGVNVGIVDERSEIAAVARGVPSNDVGLRTDVYDSCPKTKGIFMMLRALSPNIIITDEIGGPGDAGAVMAAMNAGVRIIATAHGYSLEDVESRPEIRELEGNNVFETYIILSSRNGPGTLERIVKRGR